MSETPPFIVDPGFQPVFRELGIDADAIFDHPLIKPWRILKDRENCTLDATLVDGRSVRWHIKRNLSASAMTKETQAVKLLREADIPTVRLIGMGAIAGGRSFVITEDMAGYSPADKLIAGGFPFDRLCNPLADLTAKLHKAGLHHRDLYLCHFFVKADDESIDVKLIDVARVKKLPALLTRQRWIVKDLAQFWFSTLSLPITDAQREAWLARYMEGRGESGAVPMERAIAKKVARIAKHDAKLRVKEPGRNISIPSSPSPSGREKV